MWNKCLPLIQIRLFWSFYNILLLIITVSNENIPPLQFFLQGLLKNYGSGVNNFTTNGCRKVMAGT